MIKVTQGNPKAVTFNGTITSDKESLDILNNARIEVVPMQFDVESEHHLSVSNKFLLSDVWYEVTKVINEQSFLAIMVPNSELENNNG